MTVPHTTTRRSKFGLKLFQSFPKCAFGEYVDIRGYAGVVVEIVNQSLKVRSPEGSIRSYNATGLRKLFGVP